MFDPWEGTIVLQSKQVTYNLWTLLSAIDPEIAQRVVAWQIQVSPAAGGAVVATGNALLRCTGVGAANFQGWGSLLFATQASGRQSFGLNRINLKSTYLVSDTDNVSLGVVVIAA